MVKLQHAEKTDRYHITVPKDIVKGKEWSKGEHIHIAFDNNGDPVLRDKKSLARR